MSEVAWLLASFVLLVGEVIAMHNKDAEDARQVIAARVQEDERFFLVLDQGQQQFKETMEGVKTTLQATNKTIENTMPKADLELLDITPTTTHVTPEGTREVLYYAVYTNTGNDVATHVYCLGHIYPGKRGDLAFQGHSLEDFGKRWKTYRSLPTDPIHDIAPDDKPLCPIIASSVDVSQDDRTRASEGTETMYFVFRVAWSDKTGHWSSDKCASYPDIYRAPTVVEACKVGSNAPRHKEIFTQTYQ
jgi:hypothetical protein